MDQVGRKIRCSYKLPLAAACFLVMMASHAYALETLAVPRLRIEWAPTDLGRGDAGETKKSTLALKKSCDKFAIFLRQGKGPWGSGPFADVICGPAKKDDANYDYSVDSKMNSKIDASKKFDWLLTLKRIDNEKATLTLELVAAEKHLTITVIELATELDFAKLFSDKKLASLLAARINFAMPFFAIKKPAWFKDGASHDMPRPISGMSQNQNEITVFTADIEQGIFRPTVVGFLKQENEKQKQDSQKWSLEVEEKDASSLNLPKKPQYFALQFSTSRDVFLSRINEAIAKRKEIFEEKIMTFGKNIYAGFRYGIPIGKKGELHRANTPLIGLFGEFRSGPIPGLKINYDVLKESSIATEDYLATESFSRLQIGKSFGLSLGNPIINWLDVTPRLGITNLSYKQSPAEEFEGVSASYEFTQRYAPTFGLEFGLERRFSEALIRLYAYGAYSTGVSTIDRAFKTTGYRLGIDNYVQVLKLGRIKIAILGFALYESTTIAKKSSDDAASELAVSRLTLAYGFLGGGLTLAW